jgi:hypothetical protein
LTLTSCDIIKAASHVAEEMEANKT